MKAIIVIVAFAVLAVVAIIGLRNDARRKRSGDSTVSTDDGHHHSHSHSGHAHGDSGGSHSGGDSGGSH